MMAMEKESPWDLRRGPDTNSRSVSWFPQELSIPKTIYCTFLRLEHGEVYEMDFQRVGELRETVHDNHVLSQERTELHVEKRSVWERFETQVATDEDMGTI